LFISLEKEDVISVKKNILVVDDDPDICEITKQTLLDEGFQPTCVTNGEDAIKIINESKFDLIITDLAMPEVDGFELMKWVLTVNDDIPIIAISGLEGNECMLNMAQYLGADCIIKKPFDNYDLLKNVYDLLCI